MLSTKNTVGGITELSRPGFSKTLVLVLNQVLKIQNWVQHNKTLIAQNPVLIFQSYPKNQVFILKPGLESSVIPPSKF